MFSFASKTQRRLSEQIFLEHRTPSICSRAQVEKMITISTDKAVNPSSTMGASKYAAESLPLTEIQLVEQSTPAYDSESVLKPGLGYPQHAQVHLRKNCLWISDSKVTCFAMPIPEASKLVIDALADSKGGEIFVLKMKAFVLGQLANAFREVLSPDTDFTVETRGIIGAEKLHEELVSSEEAKDFGKRKIISIIEPIGGRWSPGKK